MARGSSCSRLPRSGRGGGPGGIRPFAPLLRPAATSHSAPDSPASSSGSATQDAPLSSMAGGRERERVAGALPRGALVASSPGGPTGRAGEAGGREGPPGSPLPSRPRSSPAPAGGGRAGAGRGVRSPRHAFARPGRTGEGSEGAVADAKGLWGACREIASEPLTSLNLAGRPPGPAIFTRLFQGRAADRPPLPQALTGTAKTVRAVCASQNQGPPRQARTPRLWEGSVPHALSRVASPVPLNSNPAPMATRRNIPRLNVPGSSCAWRGEGRRP